MKIIHNWDKENYKATCVIKDKNCTFVGEAQCHPDDAEFASAITGGYIAEGRAYIKLYQHIKNNELYPQIKILEHTLNIVKSNKNYNPKDIGTIRLKQELARKKSELEQIKLAIKNEENNLRDYIADKDKLHKLLGKRKQSSN